MEFTSTVWYHSALTYYHVTTRDGNTFKARLLNAQEELEAQPPKEVVLEMENGNWKGEGDEDVLHFLRFDIERKLKTGELFG